VSNEQTIAGQALVVPAESGELLGDLRPLLAQLGSWEGLVRLSAASTRLKYGGVDSLEALRTFLEAYRTRILLPQEVPVICRAYHHARRNETRELVALDHEVAAQQFLRDFASASAQVGQSQLRRLSPIRDQRIVRRYLQAVERGQARGWHTLVYGLTLALYSLPLRQGLMNYARRMLNGFIDAAAESLRLSETECRELAENLCEPLPAELESAIDQ
jgi:urease accessory protein UreF